MNEPGIFHCHHYNCYLQAVLLDTVNYLPEAEQLLIDRIQEISYTRFSSFFQENKEWEEQEKKYVMEDYFRFVGFGKINLLTRLEIFGIPEIYAFSTYSPKHWILSGLSLKER